MIKKSEFTKANNAYLLAMLVAGMIGGFLMGICLEIARVDDLTIRSLVRIIWAGIVVMIFGSPWVLLPLALLLNIPALLLYFYLPRFLSPTRLNYIVTSLSVFGLIVLITHLFKWVDYNLSQSEGVILMVIVISVIVFGCFFYKFSQKPS